MKIQSDQHPSMVRDNKNAAGSASSGLWQQESLSFDDVLDMVNPLQHVPVVAAIYREVSGDQIGALPRLVGGALFGGLLGSVLAGVATAAAQVLLHDGQDPGEQQVAMMQEEPEGTALSPPAPIQDDDLPAVSHADAREPQEEEPSAPLARWLAALHVYQDNQRGTG